MTLARKGNDLAKYVSGTMDVISCHPDMQTQLWDEGENNRHDSLFGQCAALRNRAMWKCTKDTAFHCVT